MYSFQLLCLDKTLKTHLVHVNPFLIHFNVWQKPLQYCKVISLQLIKINGGKKKNQTHPVLLLLPTKYTHIENKQLSIFFRSVPLLGYFPFSIFPILQQEEY